MMPVVALATGALAGFIHVLSGPDHLAAVSPIAVVEPRRGWRIGLSWGAGHAAGVWAIALAATFFKQALPMGLLTEWSETLVGVVLIVVGLWTLRRAFHHRIHYHEHTHGAERHSHFHVHGKREAGGRHAAHRHSHTPMGIGLLHGLAGSSHLVGVLPALLLPTHAATAAYVGGYGLGAVTAMAGFTGVIGGVAHGWLRKHPGAYNLVLGGFAVLAVGIGMAWLIGV